jgi:tetratricopeptide (TPR) repeat protein
LLAAEVPEFQAALRRDQRRLQESEVLLREAITRYEQVLHDSHLAGRARISLGTTYLVAGRPAESLRESCEAAIHLDPRREPRFVVGIFHNLSLCLSDLGRKRAAVCLLQTARPLYDLLAGPLFRLRATWLEGRLYLGLKDWLSAAACFEAARRAFIERALRYDAALVALELALVYAENRDFRRVALLAAEMYPVFLSQEIPREASASLLLFADAARERRVTARSIAATIAEISALRHRRPRPDGASAPPP